MLQTEDESTAHLKFEAIDFDLESIPSNTEDAEARATMMPWVRMAAVLSRYSDEELERLVGSEVELHMDVLEGITSVIAWHKEELGICERAFARLHIVLERFAERQDDEVQS